jgi:riboflavin synthase alpha subunit
VFTGLIREVGRIERVSAQASITRLRIEAPLTTPDLAIGDSLAVNGICLTVTALAGDRLDVDATPETRRVTTLPGWAPGDGVHLEPSLRAGDAIGGHFVLGHVDGVGRVAGLQRRGGAAVLRVALPSGLASQLLPKGSIAVDGVSLTLDEGPFRDAFSITLVPHTLAVTRLGRLRPGDAVNLELDILAKAARTAAEPGRPITLASLFARGWQAPPRS